MATSKQINLKITQLTSKINRLNDELAIAKKSRMDLKVDLRAAKEIEAAKAAAEKVKKAKQAKKAKKAKKTKR